MAGRMGYAFFLFWLARRTTSQTCYYPNGAPVDGHRPCPGVNSSSHGSCCNVGNGWPATDTCMSNGYCFSNRYGTMYRGSCTDKDWGPSSGCPLQCKNINTGGNAKLAPCQNSELCCTSVDDAANNDCCANHSFAWGVATFDGPLNASTLSNITAGTIAAPIEGSVGVGGLYNGTQATGKTFSVGAIAGVGAGLGVPLLIALEIICWLAFVLSKERRLKRAASEATSLAPPYEAKGSGPALNGYAGHPNGFIPPAFLPQQVPQAVPAYAVPGELKASPAVGPVQPVQAVQELGVERDPQEAPTSP